MIFPNYSYQEYNNSNKKDWPIQSWCDMLNLSNEYCKTLDDVFEFEDQCREVDLPSEHPYWKLQSFKRTLELIDFTRGFIAQTRKFIKNNPDNSRVGNAKSTIETQKKEIMFYYKSLTDTRR